MGVPVRVKKSSFGVLDGNGAAGQGTVTTLNIGSVTQGNCLVVLAAAYNYQEGADGNPAGVIHSVKDSLGNSYFSYGEQESGATSHAFGYMFAAKDVIGAASVDVEVHFRTDNNFNKVTFIVLEYENVLDIDVYGMVGGFTNDTSITVNLPETNTTEQLVVGAWSGMWSAPPVFSATPTGYTVVDQYNTQSTQEQNLHVVEKTLNSVSTESLTWTHQAQPFGMQAGALTLIGKPDPTGGGGGTTTSQSSFKVIAYPDPDALNATEGIAQVHSLGGAGKIAGPDLFPNNSLTFTAATALDGNGKAPIEILLPSTAAVSDGDNVAVIARGKNPADSDTIWGSHFLIGDVVALGAPEPESDQYAEILNIDFNDIEIVDFPDELTWSNGNAAASATATRLEGEFPWRHYTTTNAGRGARGLFVPGRDSGNNYYGPFGYEGWTLDNPLPFTPVTTSGGVMTLNARTMSAEEEYRLNRKPAQGVGTGSPITVRVPNWTYSHDHVWVGFGVPGVTGGTKQDPSTYTITGSGSAIDVTINPPSGVEYTVQSRPHKLVTSVVSLRNTFKFRYGKITLKFRCINPSNGQWFGAWLIPSAKNDVYPPEIDLIETDGGQPTKGHFNVHGPELTKRATDGGYSNGATQAYSGWVDIGDTSQITTIVFEWTESKMEWTVNGQIKHTVNNTGAVRCDTEMTCILSLEQSTGDNNWPHTGFDSTSAAVQGVEIHEFKVEQKPSQLTDGPRIVTYPVIAGSTNIGDEISVTTAPVWSGESSVSNQWEAEHYPIELDDTDNKVAIGAQDTEQRISLVSVATGPDGKTARERSNKIWVPAQSVNAVQNALNDMTQPNELTLDGANPLKGWAQGPVIAMGMANVSDATPGGGAGAYWFPSDTNLSSGGERWDRIVPWFVFYRGIGDNQSANVRVAIRNLALWIQDTSFAWNWIGSTWDLVGDNYDPDVINTYGAADLRVSSGGWREFKMPTGAANNVHGWGTPFHYDITGNYLTTMRNLLVRYEVKLVVDDPNLADDRTTARILSNGGADFYPYNQNSTAVFAPTGYAPGSGGNRYKLVTNNWETRYYSPINTGFTTGEPATLSLANRTVTVGEFTSENPPVN